MEFIKTISKLIENTEELYVYAMYAYSTEGPCIGIRASYYGDMHNDPKIGNNTFMVCGTILDRTTWDMVKTMGDLKQYLNDTSSLCVRLHADVLAAPAMTEISLGDYYVTGFVIQEIDKYDGTLERVKLNLKRRVSSFLNI